MINQVMQAVKRPAIVSIGQQPVDLVEQKKQRLEFQTPQIQSTLPSTTNSSETQRQPLIVQHSPKKAPRATRTEPSPQAVRKVPDLLKKSKKDKSPGPGTKPTPPNSGCKLINQANQMLASQKKITESVSRSNRAETGSDIFSADVPNISISQSKSSEKNKQTYMQPSSSKSGIQLIMDRVNKGEGIIHLYRIILQSKLQLRDPELRETL